MPSREPEPAVAVVPAAPLVVEVLGGVGEQRQPSERPDEVDLVVEAGGFERLASVARSGWRRCGARRTAVRRTSSTRSNVSSPACSRKTSPIKRPSRRMSALASADGCSAVVGRGVGHRCIGQSSLRGRSSRCYLRIRWIDPDLRLSPRDIVRDRDARLAAGEGLLVGMVVGQRVLAVDRSVRTDAPASRPRNAQECRTGSTP